ncbi:MAG TPA: hypothetical protein VK897_20975 [Anaerolineales bacterium]|nr:hypothetical protein [Anaerolineales bacterium]
MSFRPALPGDEAFLTSVYANTRMEEMNMVDWKHAQKETFVRMQLRAQSPACTENDPGAECKLILLEGLPSTVEHDEDTRTTAKH